jgi:ribosome-binding factor A
MTRRIERVNHQLRLEISDLLQHHIKDPRLSSLIGVTEVITSPDLRYAKVFVSCICDDKEKQGMLRVLESASGFVRNELGKRLRLRRLPELSFHWDDSIERGARILDLIDKVSDHDR